MYLDSPRGVDHLKSLLGYRQAFFVDASHRRPVRGQTPFPKKTRCVAFELYTRTSDAEGDGSRPLVFNLFPERKCMELFVGFA